MEILDYFDQQFLASVPIEQLVRDEPCVLVVLVEDLLKLANEKLSDELNWVLDCIQKDKNSFEFTSITKSVRRSLKRSYFEQSDKRELIDYILSLMKDHTYNTFVIDKAKEILQVIVEQLLKQRVSKVIAIFGGTVDLDELMALKKANSINTFISASLQQPYIQQQRKKKKYMMQQWNISNLTPGTLFMTQAQNAFRRSNMPFIDCQYQIVESEVPGSKNRKLLNVLRQHIGGSNRHDTNYIILARDRTTLLKTIAFAGKRRDIYFQMTDVDNFLDYQLQSININILATIMQKTAMDDLNSLLAFITLFRNSIIELPLPTHFYSIPAIIELYQHLAKIRPEQSLLNRNYQLNAVYMQRLMTVAESINEFYLRHKAQIVRIPNLIYLFIIGAVVETKNGTLKVSNSIILRHNKNFPPKQLDSSSTAVDFQFIYKYQDQFYTDPDILFLTNNTDSSCQYVSKQLQITHQQLKYAKQSRDNFTCPQYIQQLQKIIFELFGLFDASTGFNTIIYEHSIIPQVSVLRDYFKTTYQPFSVADISKGLQQIKIKPSILALITIPLGSVTKHLFPREIGLNQTNILREYQPLVSQYDWLLQSLTDKSEIVLVSPFHFYIYQIRFKDFVISTGQMHVLIDKLIPFFNKLILSNK